MFRRREGQLEVFLVHPGGPFWARKDLGAWSIPKGEFEEGEDPLATARREFAEETGSAVEGEFLPLGEVKQPGGKWVSAFALEYDFDTALMKSNTFTLEWPPKSGNSKEFPEVDKCGWFSLPVAREKLLKGQIDFLMRLENSLDLRVKAKA